MKESYDEGVANHIDPESCAEDRKGLSEALTGARAGWVWSRGILLKSREPTWWDEAEGNNGRTKIVPYRYWTKKRAEQFRLSVKIKRF